MNWPWSKPCLSRAEKALVASKLGVASQDVGKIRGRSVRATENGLLAVVPADVRQRVRAKLSQAGR